MFNPNEHLMDLKGKKYLQVMWRLVWFREDKPNWCIDTHMESLTDTHAVFTAKIYDECGVMKASGYGSESVKDFRDFIEKAETKAIGRALAMLGYGTQFAPELDEGERIVDSPVGFSKVEEYKPLHICADCGQAVKDTEYHGKKYSADSIAAKAVSKHGVELCWDCLTKRGKGDGQA